MAELSEKQQNDILARNDDNRYQYLLEQAKQQQCVWILADEVGAVMFTDDDENDLVPIWPEAVFAELWRSEEWQHCEAKAISLEKWVKDWSPGLEKDEINVLVFPNQDNQGLVVEPWELHGRLKGSLQG